MAKLVLSHEQRILEEVTVIMLGQSMDGFFCEREVMSSVFDTWSVVWVNYDTLRIPVPQAM
jgi:hypothetical protein